MFTLLYMNGQLNRPDKLLPFLQSNLGEWPLLQIDCITPYQGTEEKLINVVCDYLNNIDRGIEVAYNLTQNVSITSNGEKSYVSFLVIQIHVTQRI